MKTTTPVVNILLSHILCLGIVVGADLTFAGEDAAIQSSENNNDAPTNPRTPSEVGVEAEDPVKQLIDATMRRDYRVRLAAVRKLGRMGPAARTTAMESLIATIKEHDGHVPTDII